MKVFYSTCIQLSESVLELQVPDFQTSLRYYNPHIPYSFSRKQPVTTLPAAEAVWSERFMTELKWKQLLIWEQPRSGNLSSAQLDLDSEVRAKNDRSFAKKKHTSSRNQFSVRFFFKVLFFQQKCLLALYHPTHLSDFNPVPHSPWEKHFIASSFPAYGSSWCHWLWMEKGKNTNQVDGEHLCV